LTFFSVTGSASSPGGWGFPPGVECPPAKRVIGDSALPDERCSKPKVRPHSPSDIGKTNSKSDDWALANGAGGPEAKPAVKLEKLSH
jgi:hypothetical protein